MYTNLLLLKPLHSFYRHHLSAAPYICCASWVCVGGLWEWSCCNCFFNIWCDHSLWEYSLHNNSSLSWAPAEALQAGLCKSIFVQYQPHWVCKSQGLMTMPVHVKIVSLVNSFLCSKFQFIPCCKVVVCENKCLTNLWWWFNGFLCNDSVDSNKMPESELQLSCICNRILQTSKHWKHPITMILKFFSFSQRWTGIVWQPGAGAVDNRLACVPTTNTNLYRRLLMWLMV